MGLLEAWPPDLAGPGILHAAEPADPCRGPGGGASPRFWYEPPPPPCPLPCPPGPLSYQGSIAAGHIHGGAEGAPNFFFIPLAHIAPLPAQALERGWEAPPLP